jgi:hypothetical protein
MGFRRRVAAVVVVIAAAVAAALAAAPAAPAGSLDECAQRVIRDWYTGGRVDDVYPLPCYRAALRALPADVLQYSNADQDIRRALAYARRGRGDPGAAPPPPAPATPRKAKPKPKPAAPAPPAKQAGGAANGRAAKRPAQAPPAKVAAPPEQAAALTAERPAASGSVPYPILVLTALAAVLLTTGAAGWVLGRRR